MKKQGVIRAALRLESSKLSLQDADNATNAFDFVRNWSAFLSSMDSIYNCLAKSKGDSSTSRKWFESVEKNRKDDQLLNYLWHARNADNHGIDDPIQIEPGRTIIGGGAEQGFSRHIAMQFSTVPGEEFIAAQSLDGKPVKHERIAPTNHLLPVVDRGVTYQPPTEHLGVSIGEVTPKEAGDLAIAYFEKRISEAMAMTA